MDTSPFIQQVLERSPYDHHSDARAPGQKTTEPTSSSSSALGAGAPFGTTRPPRPALTVAERMAQTAQLVEEVALTSGILTEELPGQQLPGSSTTTRGRAIDDRKSSHTGSTRKKAPVSSTQSRNLTLARGRVFPLILDDRAGGSISPATRTSRAASSGNAKYDNFSRNYEFDPARRIPHLLLPTRKRSSSNMMLSKGTRNFRTDTEQDLLQLPSDPDVFLDQKIMHFIRKKPTEFPVSGKMYAAHFKTAYLVKQYDDFFEKCSRNDADLRFLKRVNSTQELAEYKSPIEKHYAESIMGEIAQHREEVAKRGHASHGSSTVFRPGFKPLSHGTHKWTPAKTGTLPKSPSTSGGYYHKAATYRSGPGTGYQFSPASLFEAGGRTFDRIVGSSFSSSKRHGLDVRKVDGNQRFAYSDIAVPDKERNIAGVLDGLDLDLHPHYQSKARKGESLNPPVSKDYQLDRFFESLNPPVSKDYQLDRFFVGGRRKFLSGFTDLDLASPHIDCYSPSVASFSAPRARSAGDVGNRVMRDVSPMHFARAAAGLQVYHGKKSYRSTAEFDRPTARKIGLESATYEESLLKTKLTPPLVSTSVSSYVEKGAGSRAGKNSNNVISRRSATSTATAPSYHSLPDSYSLRAGGLNGTGVAAGSSAVKYNDDAGAEVVPSFLKNLLLSVERTEDYEKKVNQLLHNETGRNLTEFKVDRAEFDHKIGQIYDNAMNCGSGTSKGGGGSITSRRAQGYYFIAGGIRNGIRTRTQNDEQETTTAPPASSALLFRQKINQQNERKEWLFANQRIQHGNSPLNKLHETRNRVLMEDNKILPTAKTYEYKNLLVSNRAVYPSYLGSVSNSEAHRKLLLVANRFGSLRPGTRNLADCF